MPHWAMGRRACSDFPKPFHTGAWQDPQRLNRPEKQKNENPCQGHPSGQVPLTWSLLNKNLPIGEAEKGARRGPLNASQSPQALRDRFWTYSFHNACWVDPEDGAGSALLVPGDLLWQKRNGRQARSHPLT